ncbi:MAG: beta strand repeat-containing protein [Planctomycetaceae bacterium]
MTVANPTLLNHEDAQSHTIKGRAYTSIAGSSVKNFGPETSFVINVDDVRPTAPVDCDPAANTVPEAAAVGTPVGITLSSSDINGAKQALDPKIPVQYELTDDAGGAFHVDPVTGVVTVANSTLLNYEAARSHTIKGRAYTMTGTGSPKLTGGESSFVIAVTDVAVSAPVDANSTANAVVEGVAAGSAVGITLSSTDPNGATIQYELTDDAGGRFAVNATTGIITVARPELLNHETNWTHTVSARAVVIRANAVPQPGAASTFTIGIDDLRTPAPVDQDTTANRVTEAATVGSLVGITALSSDVNGGGLLGSLGNSVYYRLSDDAGGRFDINADSGVVTLARPDLINFDAARSHTITVVPFVKRLDSTIIDGEPTTIPIEVVLKANPDLVLKSATAAGANSLVITYDVLYRGVDSGSVDLGMALSSDAVFTKGQDAVVSRISLSGADLTLGSHTKTITLGTGSGKLAMPGAGLTDPDIDYRLLAVLDPDGVFDERQLSADGTSSLPSKENNSTPFVGSYCVAPGPLMIHGTDLSDVVTITGTTTLSVGFQGATRFYPTSQLTSVRLRMHDGNENLAFGSLTIPLLLAGGAGQDSLTGGTGSDVLIGGAGNDVLAGGSGNDRYSFDTDLPLGTDTLTDTAGTDTLDFSLTTGVSNTVRLGDAVAQVVNANLTIQLNSASAFENVTGGMADDALYGNSLVNRIEGLAGNDLLSGGTGNDTYVFVADTALGTDTVVEASTNGTADLLDFDGTLSNITVDLAIATEQTVNSSLKLVLSQGATIENVSGGSGDDTILANLLVNRLEGRGGNDRLEGRAGNDTYVFAVNVPLGTDTLTETSTGGVDTLDFSATVSDGLTVNLSEGATQVVSSRLSIVLGSASLFENIVGGNGPDALQGNALANSLTGNGGYDVLVGLAGNDTLIGNGDGNRLEGGSGNDLYMLDADLALGTNTVVEGAGEGIDTLDFSLTTLLGLTVDLGITTEQSVTAAATTRLILTSTSNVENLVGGSQNDTLIGNSVANDIKGGLGNDTIRTGVGDDRLEGAAGDDILDGGTGNDTYVFPVTSSLNLGSDLVQEAIDGGNDVLDFSAATVAIKVDLASILVQQTALLHRLTLASGAVIEQVRGGSGADIISGNALDNVLLGNAGNDVIYGQAGSDTLNGGAGNDALDGGDGGDRYQFIATSALGADTISEAATASGTDSLDFTGTTLAVSVDLSLATSQVVNSNVSLVLGSGTALEAVTGGSGNDTLRGNTLANILDGAAGNDQLIVTDGLDTLRGGAGDDSYRFRADFTSASVTVDEAGGGTDLLDFASYTLGAIRVDLAQTVSQAVSDRVQLLLANSANPASSGIENVTGTAFGDEIRGNELANLLIGGSGADLLSGRGGNDTLQGGLGGDTYAFDADVALGVDTLQETGTDVDTLDFAQTTAAVSVNLGLATSQVVNSALSLILGSATLFENATGGDGADTLTGSTSANRLTGGLGNDRLTGGGGDDVLDGGAGDDAYVFAGTAALGVDTLFDGDGIDSLDFSQSTAAVNLSLANTSQQVVNSQLQLKLDSAIQFEIIIGSPLNDLLVGNALGNVFFGGAGADILMGNSGRDILVGGTGSDDSFGGADEDILMDGSWQLYSESTRVAQLSRIIDVSRDWLGSGTFAERVLRLRSFSSPLNTSTVTLDAAIDRVWGDDGLDWFWIGVEDQNDRQPSPELEPLR